MKIADKMNPPVRKVAGFSLVEVTLALGVAALCLLVLLGLLPTGVKTQQNGIQQTTANQILSQLCSFLRADVRLPPGLYQQVCPNPPDPSDPCNWDQLHGHWLNVAQPPDCVYFTQTAKQTGNVSSNCTGSPPSDAVFRAKLTYNPGPPTGSTSVANVVVSWPAPVDPSAGGVPAGSVTELLSVNR
jgi:type II secretory pathway pseudopilin PulG